jgi:hypothetical protein
LTEYREIYLGFKKFREKERKILNGIEQLILQKKDIIENVLNGKVNIEIIN